MAHMSTMLIVFLVAIVPVTGIILAVTPWLMRRGECFAVTIPSAAQADPQLKGFKKSYAALVVTVSLVCAAGLAAVMLMSIGSDGTVANEVLVVGAILAFMLVPCVVSFGLMLHFRKKVQKLKQERGWSARSNQSVAVISEEDIPRAVPLAWNLLYVPVVLATTALVVLLYPSMPDVIPTHVNFAGAVDGTMTKGIGVAVFPLAIEVFIAVVVIGTHVGIMRSKKPTEPGSPVTSAYAYGLFVRAQSAFMVALGVLISAGIGISFVLSAAQIISIEQMGAIVLVIAALAVVGSLVLTFVYGQAGSRLYQRMGDRFAEDELSFDDDEHWKLGIFYWNKDDASVFLPKRFGFGWTVNLARPATWAIIVGLVAVTVIFLAISFAVAG